MIIWDAVEGVKTQSFSMLDVAKLIEKGHLSCVQSDPVNPGSQRKRPVVGSFSKEREVVSVMRSRKYAVSSAALTTVVAVSKRNVLIVIVFWKEIVN